MLFWVTLGASTAYYFFLSYLCTRTSNINTWLKAPVLPLINLDRSYVYFVLPLLSFGVWGAFNLEIGADYVKHFFDHIQAITFTVEDFKNNVSDGWAIILTFFGFFIVVIPLFILMCLSFPVTAFMKYIGIYLVPFYIALTLPFVVYALTMIGHYLFTRHPLEKYIKSGEQPPPDAIKELEEITGKQWAFVYENYRLKAEKIVQEMDRKEALEKKRQQEEIDNEKRKKEYARQQEEARKQREQAKELKTKARAEKAKYGNKDQRDRRTAFNNAQADLINRFVKPKKK